MRAIAIGLFASSLALTWTQAAELPTRAAVPRDPPAKRCEIAGVRGFLTEGGVCVRLSGFVSGQAAVGSSGRSYVLAPQTRN
jgi:hypothetical protein